MPCCIKKQKKRTPSLGCSPVLPRAGGSDSIQEKRLRDKPTWQNVAYRIFSAIYLLAMVCLCGLLVTQNNVVISLVAIAAAGGLFLLTNSKMARWVDSIDTKKFYFFIVGALLLYFFAASFAADAMKIFLPPDTGITYTAALDLIDDGLMNDSRSAMLEYGATIGQLTTVNADYFCLYPTNIALLLVFFSLLTVGSWFGINIYDMQGHTLIIAFTALTLAFTIWLLFRFVMLHYKRNSLGLAIVALCACFTPFYYALPNFYSDILIIFPTCLGLYLLYRCFISQRLLFLIAGALVLCFAAMLKMTSVIPLIALVIVVLLVRHISWKRRLLYFSAFFAIFIGGIALFTLWYTHSPWFDFSRAEELKMPVALWLCCGAYGGGNFNAQEVFYAASFSDYSTRSAAMWSRLIEIYKNYTLYSYLRFSMHKMILVWNDGFFESSIYTLWPLESNWSYLLTQPHSQLYQFIWFFSQVYKMALYFFALASAVISFLKKKLDESFFLNLSMFGVMLFLHISEAAPRRALIAIPFLLLGCIYTLSHKYKVPGLFARKHPAGSTAADKK